MKMHNLVRANEISKRLGEIADRLGEIEWTRSELANQFNLDRKIFCFYQEPAMRVVGKPNVTYFRMPITLMRDQVFAQLLMEQGTLQNEAALLHEELATL